MLLPLTPTKEDLTTFFRRAGGVCRDVLTDPATLIAGGGLCAARRERFNNEKEKIMTDECTNETMLRIGARVQDGNVYAGISPNTHKPMYTTPKDAPLTYTFNEAVNYAEQLNAQKYLSHDDWRPPTKDELHVLFTNRAAIGGFYNGMSHPRGWYCSSSEGKNDDAWDQLFTDGYQFVSPKQVHSSLRCVRG
jgi:hypothetical protein